jgi:phage-related tail fiber protein
VEFTALLEQHGRTATGLAVPPEVVDALGAGRRPAVTVTLRGHRYPSTIATMGGRFMLPVSAQVRAQTGVAAGDEVEVTVALDTAVREVVVPADLAEALAQDETARTAFEALPYSHQRRHVLAVEGAKAAETRARRVASAVTALREGRGRG